VLLYRQILRKRFGWLAGIDRAKKPAGLPLVSTRDEERAVLARLNRVRSVMARLLYGSGLRLMEYASCASRTSIRIKTPSSDSGFDYELPCDCKIVGEQYATLAPRVLVDRGVLLGRQYRSLSHGMTAFHRGPAPGGRSSAAADIASARAGATWDRKDPAAPAAVPPYAASGTVATLARRPPLLRSLWRVPPTWAYCVESGPK
jgi:hypothetical protein